MNVALFSYYYLEFFFYYPTQIFYNKGKYKVLKVGLFYPCIFFSVTYKFATDVYPAQSCFSSPQREFIYFQDKSVLLQKLYKR